MAGLLASAENLACVQVLCEPEALLVVDALAATVFNSILSLQVLDVMAKVFHHSIALTLHVPRVAFLSNEALRGLPVKQWQEHPLEGSDVIMEWRDAQ